MRDMTTTATLGSWNLSLTPPAASEADPRVAAIKHLKAEKNAIVNKSHAVKGSHDRKCSETSVAKQQG